jgi:hypothetical protein
MSKPQADDGDHIREKALIYPELSCYPKQQIDEQIAAIFAASCALEKLFPGRPFTPDGHMVGSIGEVIAATRYGLTLVPPSTKGYDATTPDGRKVEIKATFGNRGVALRENHADLLVVLRLSRDGEHEEVYYGPADQAWARAGGMQSNGQRTVSLAQLRRLGQER